MIPSDQKRRHVLSNEHPIQRAEVSAQVECGNHRRIERYVAQLLVIELAPSRGEVGGRAKLEHSGGTHMTAVECPRDTRANPKKEHIQHRADIPDALLDVTQRS